MVPLDHHERAKREVQLIDEQAAEMVYRQQHEHCTMLVQNAEEERNRAVQDGQRARQELERETQELQRATSRILRIVLLLSTMPTGRNAKSGSCLKDANLKGLNPNAVMAKLALICFL